MKLYLVVVVPIIFLLLYSIKKYISGISTIKDRISNILLQKSNIKYYLSLYKSHRYIWENIITDKVLETIISKYKIKGKGYKYIIDKNE